MAGRLIDAPPRRRRVAWLLLVLAVVAVHGCVTRHLAERLADMGAEAAMPQRVEVVYVRDMELSAPPAVAPAPPPPAPKPRRPRRPAPVEPAASAPPPQALPEPVPPEPALPAEVELEPVPSEPPPLAQALRQDQDPAPAAPAASTPSPFEWPGSTSLSYVLTGNYRGEIHGDAVVEWVRVGAGYQVHLDVTVGLPFAPLFTRRMTSQGQLTPEGLWPERFDQDTKRAFRDRQRLSMRFEHNEVVLANGRRAPRLAGLQDAASQFVQMSFQFTTQPQLLRSGSAIEMPLGLPRYVDRWVYDVLEPETLYTPFGAVDTYAVKPRRATRRGGDLIAEAWFAPSLQYLPARIRIEQDADTYIDLMIARKPQLAAPIAPEGVLP